jgi:hypothetical protein
LEEIYSTSAESLPWNMSSSMTPEQWDVIEKYPAIQPPMGVQPNFEDPKDQN